MKVRCITSYGYGCITDDGVYEVIGQTETHYLIKTKYGIKNYRKNLFEIVKENETMRELSFKEVIAEIKEGEAWESVDHSLLKKICRTSMGIAFDFKPNISHYGVGFTNNDKFRLKEKEYTFTEAWKAYEEGKEIESCESEFIYRIIDNEGKIRKINCGKWENCDLFDSKEIRGKWKIRQAEK